MVSLNYYVLKNPPKTIVSLDTVGDSARNDLKREKPNHAN